MRRILSLLLVLASGPAIAQDDDNAIMVAVLQGLNKVTARISRIETPVGAAAYFGNLELVVEKCWKAPPTEQPENAGLLSIREQKPNEVKAEIFHGWMFSSSPSLSGLEHPVYDVTLLSCERKPLNEN